MKTVEQNSPSHLQRGQSLNADLHFHVVAVRVLTVLTAIKREKREPLSNIKALFKT